MNLLGFLWTALSVALASATPLSKRSTQVSLISQAYSGSTLSGTIKVQNIAYTKVVTVTWAVDDNWSGNTISAVYASGPDSSGYEVWSFSGTASGATQFYITYTVNGASYYDPGNNVNYQIAASVDTFAPVTGLDTWLTTEASLAQALLQNNIGSTNNTIVGPGVVIASPSTSSPNYFYQWTRDSSVVMEHLVNEYIANGAYLQYIKDWVTVQSTLQHLTNPSGSFTTGGLGEPKFNVDNTAFTGAWGRPQRDGPALRAITLMKFANKYKSADFPTVIKPDLDYVATYWNQGGFDLWEETSGTQFFTTMVQYRSMIEGAAFATSMGDTTSKNTYTGVQANIVTTINSFWSSSKNYIIALINGGRSGIDCGNLLGSLRGGSYILGPSDSKVLATLHALISSFQSLYAINQSASKVGWAIGRYPEDVYDGVGTSQANPWFICTTTSAHIIYKALSEFTAAGAITIDSTSINFFKRFNTTATAGTYSLSSTAGKNLYTGLFNYADTFLGVVKQYAKSTGNLSEQFSKDNGQQVGAHDLTWSYEAILEAIKARNAVKTPPTTTFGCAATVTITVTVMA
ncbi:Glucoamylase [Arthrobotrys entomopaga]|nr:Glucoamylase [Arthrobotrys entomopaga]